MSRPARAQPAAALRPALSPLHRALLLAGGLALAPWPAAQAQATAPKPRIEKAADLPRFAYTPGGQLEAVVRSDQLFAPLAAAVRGDTERLLADYDIPDKATRRDLLNLLAMLDFLDGRYASAMARADEVQRLQDKPSDKLLSGLRLRAMATAAQQHAPGSAAYVQAVGGLMAQALKPLPFAVVENDVKSAKASAEVIGEALILGRVREVLQPTADANGGQLSSDLVPGLVGARFALQQLLPLKAVSRQAYADFITANQVVKADIWAARDVVLAADAAAQPVRLAVWDSGVDTALYPQQLQRDAEGRVAYIGFDKYARPEAGPLMPIPSELASKLGQMVARTKGFSDLQSNIDSAEASQVKQLLSGLKPDGYKQVIEEVGLAGNYEHGTHVAGIALAGNPFARLVIGRISYGHTLRPDPCPSRELTERDARNSQATVDYFKQQGVRVVNMSWGGSVKDIERELEQCGLGRDAAARQAEARVLFDIGKTALTRAFASAPEILFIASAGNSNSDATFTETLPADIVLPNLLTVGAVDKAGDEAPFTSFGPTVKLHANGYQVESYLPGGARVALSGTSMSAPQASNLAAKLLAVKPSLTPQQLIALMTDTADRSADGRRVLMNPKAALAAAQAQR
ncbi:MAG: hypothetical protein CFE39_13015 [Comamonadaceae bacterium PBBC2]|nr:MAG: hypothetical protein CFE39_13015 [Comamonadaceae bacterium PBBC2]